MAKYRAKLNLDQLVAEVLSAQPHSVHQHVAEGSHSVRFGLPGDYSGPLDGGLREVGHQAGSAAEGAERQCGEVVAAGGCELAATLKGDTSFR